ncbi:DUF7282 domain-containing protein [Marinobacter sp. C2H3]|uniref:DUF7282 domain-containing protein n=1 Tax=Marinobacter sp. C2H3 TaxID=3119003 RepID=UPI00300F21EA
MNKRVKTSAFLASALVAGAFIAGPAMADDHGKMDDMAKGSMEKMGKMHDLAVWGSDQSMADGTVTAKKVNTTQNGWLVVHRTADGMKPGPVVGYAPLKKGSNMDVAAILTEQVKAGDKLMLMVHGEDGGMKTGAFEYTLGAKEDGPLKADGKLVMAVVTAK